MARSYSPSREGDAAHRAIDEYGTQFHFSRAYLQCSLYLELEALLEQIAGRPVLVAASTSLAHLDLSSLQRSPIFQAQCDSPRIAFAVAEEMKARGFYCSVCVFPAVPTNRPGLRFTIRRHNELEDIAPFVSALAESFDRVRSEPLEAVH